MIKFEEWRLNLEDGLKSTVVFTNKVYFVTFVEV